MRRITTHLPEWMALSGAVFAHEAAIATFEFQKLVESGTSRLRNDLCETIGVMSLTVSLGSRDQPTPQRSDQTRLLR